MYLSFPVAQIVAMNITGIFLVVLVVVWVIRKFKQDLPAGMRLVFALLVFLPDSLRIPVPTGFPQLTVHRLLIVIAFTFLIGNRSPDRIKWPIPNILLIM